LRRASPHGGWRVCGTSPGKDSSCLCPSSPCCCSGTSAGLAAQPGKCLLRGNKQAGGCETRLGVLGPQGPFLNSATSSGRVSGRVTHARLCRQAVPTAAGGLSDAAPRALLSSPEVRGPAGSISSGWAAWRLGVQQHGTVLGYVRGGGEGDRGTARLHTCHGGMRACPCWGKT